MTSHARLASTICPMCGRGHLSSMILMETLSCPICNHMFSWNAYQKQIDVLDVSSPLGWRWNGRKWQRGSSPTPSLTPITLFFAIIIVLLPVLMIETASYMFPPLPGSRFEHFHMFWAAIAFVLHGLWVGWIMAESQHFTSYTLAKVKVKELFHRLKTSSL